MENVKNVLKWIVFPFALLLGGIFYLLSQVGTLKDVIAKKDAEKALGKALDKLEEAKANADSKEADFNRQRDAYRDARKPDGDS